MVETIDASGSMEFNVILKVITKLNLIYTFIGKYSPSTCNGLEIGKTKH